MIGVECLEEDSDGKVLRVLRIARKDGQAEHKIIIKPDFIADNLGIAGYYFDFTIGSGRKKAHVILKNNTLNNKIEGFACCNSCAVWLHKRSRGVLITLKKLMGPGVSGRAIG
ncbi:hypothetical protein ZEAMMB73_Zm00001d030030 [Zea mays]|uniref:Uncharacterized protein n=1 Tax=Zea mays TaxID=4577 RepID=A0A1D6K973_MAIZE|nr:hypothetical protein ZEAMMB73_Zm00001d030030 [Zea mays]